MDKASDILAELRKRVEELEKKVAILLSDTSCREFEILGKKFDASATLDVKSVAYILSVNPRTVYRWIEEKKLCSERVGAAHIISVKNLHDFLESSRYQLSNK